jgi:hypothetical protein
MQFLRDYAGELAGIFFLAAFVPYFFQIIWGTVKPERATWIIWTILGFLILLSYKSVGAGNTIWLPLAGAVGPCAILILTYWYGVGGRTTLDIVCLVGAGIGVAAWLFTANPFVGLLCFLASDTVGAVPTYFKTWKHPRSESLVSWILWFAGSSFQLLALEHWDWAHVLYPSDYFLGQLLMIGLTLRRFRSVKIIASS